MTSKNKLNSNHKRVLSATAKIIDEQLLEIERILLESKNDSQMNIVEKSFDEKSKKDMLLLINSVKKTNLELFENFGLQSSTLSDRQKIYSKFSYLWTILTDSHSKKLQAYGKLDEETGVEIDSYIDNMLIKIDEMLKM